jgi:hypothetical protein
MNRVSGLLVVSGLLWSALPATADLAAFKQIGAPPTDVTRGWLQAPDPTEHGARSRLAQLPMTFAGDTLEIRFDVPRCGHVAIVPLGEGCAAWTISLVSPSGQVVTDDAAQVRLGHGALWPIADQDGQRIDLTDPTAGQWTMRISGGTDGQQGVLLVADDAPLVLRSVLHSYSLLEGKPVRLTVALGGLARPADLRKGGRDTVGRGYTAQGSVARWHRADGSIEAVSCDFAGGSAELVVHPTAGEHVLQLNVTVLDHKTGTTLQRTVLHRFVVESHPPVLTGTATVTTLDSHRVGIELGCTETGLRSRVLVGAEVWAVVGDTPELCAWIGGMVPVRATGLALTLDTRWLSAAGSTGRGVELRNIRLADPDSVVTLVELDRVVVGDVAVLGGLIDAAAERAMRMGQTDRGGVEIAPPHRSAAAGGHNLMLVHGYCSDTISWPPGQFTGDVAVYSNAYQNFSNDEFALDILSFGSQFKSYSIAGHSQGGNAGLHLYTFYWSGLDWATPFPQDGGRVLQALGVPFYGTALAGDLALIAEIFGFGCGISWDLTYDGAAAWLSYIPSWSRAETWTWTTTFYDGWGYDYCHLATDLFLWDPEDGVVESFSGDLDGANFMGLKDGWCHIQDMYDPPQVDDTVRNNEINAEAAR